MLHAGYLLLVVTIMVSTLHPILVLVLVDFTSARTPKRVVARCHWIGAFFYVHVCMLMMIRSTNVFVAVVWGWIEEMQDRVARRDHGWLGWC